MNPSFSCRVCLWVAGMFAALIFLAGCGSSKPKDLAGDCKLRFEKLHAKFEKGRYATAKEGYDEFVTSCAGTEFVEQAYFELGESHFALKEWMESEQEFESFLREYPGSRRYGEIARYQLAVSMANQVEIPQRDQSKTLEAIKSFETFQAEFPDSPRADSARVQLDRLRHLLAERDTRIARLYARMDEPLAAAIYYKHMLKEYGEQIPRREIILKLAECYIDLGQFVEAENQLAQFDGVAKDDPFREQVKSAQAKLQKARDRYAREKKKDKMEAEKQRAEEQSKAL